MTVWPSDNVICWAHEKYEFAAESVFWNPREYDDVVDQNSNGDDKTNDDDDDDWCWRFSVQVALWVSLLIQLSLHFQSEFHEIILNLLWAWIFGIKMHQQISKSRSYDDDDDDDWCWRFSVQVALWVTLHWLTISPRLAQTAVVVWTNISRDSWWKFFREFGNICFDKYLHSR